MSDRVIVIGTRGSRLALAQAALVVQALERAGQPSRISIIETDGDRQAPDTAWGEGAFVAAIERALLAKRVDVAVHSAKDVPTDEDSRLRIGAYLPRADPRDALVVPTDAAARRLDDLPPGSRVGTDSPRRTGFILARRPDLVVHPLHGNVDTRLHRLDVGETDALLLACAGLDRLGLGVRIAERVEPDVVPPAPGQGAIAVQIRRDDRRLLELVSVIDDPATRIAVESERAFLNACGGGCRAPIGALGTVDGNDLTLLGGFADPDGSSASLVRRRGPATAGEALARELAVTIDRTGRSHAQPVIAEPRSEQAVAPRILVTRAADQAAELLSELRVSGLDPVSVPAIAVELERPGGELDAAARHLSAYAWVVVTSANGARAVLEAASRVSAAPDSGHWAAIGQATASHLEGDGFEVQFRPSRSDSETLAVELPIERADRLLVVRGDLAGSELVTALRARGADVDEVIGYRTREAPESSRALLRRALAGGPIEAVVFTSGSTVRGLAALARLEGFDLASIPSVCIGSETAAEARAAGFSVLAVAAMPDAAALAGATARAVHRRPMEVR